MIQKNYTVRSISALQSLPDLDTAQFLLSCSSTPALRNTVESLVVLRSSDCNTDIFIHYDYLFIASRYSMFKKHIREAIIHELYDIVTYAAIDTHVKGIVMHVDYPGLIDDHLIDLFEPNVKYDWKESIDLLYRDLIDAVKIVGCPIYLENSTILGPNREGSLGSLHHLFLKHPEYGDIFGICVDTQHYASVNNHALRPNNIEDLQAHLDIPVMVHLNAIPEGTLNSGIDRHNITLFDCSIYDFEYYKYFISCLNSLGIPWIREIHDTTRECELELINKQIQ